MQTSALYSSLNSYTQVRQKHRQPAKEMINVRQCKSAAALTTPTMDALRVMF